MIFIYKNSQTFISGIEATISDAEVILCAIRYSNCSQMLEMQFITNSTRSMQFSEIKCTHTLTHTNTHMYIQTIALRSKLP